MMIAYEPMELIVTPNITYIWVEQMGEFRRIYTDGRGWPANPKPAFKGYSIGQWEGREGRYDTLLVETRHLRGPRLFDADGRRCTPTIRLSSRSASTSTGTIRTRSMTRSPP